MKKIIYILSGLALLISGLYSCRKDNINGDSSTLILGSYITLEKVNNANLNFSDPAATVSIDVKEFGSPVASVNVYLATGSNTFDPAGWKLIKNIPYSGDVTTLTVTTAEIAAALAPDAIEPGNQYTLQNEVVTKDGRKFSNANTPTNYQSFPAYNMALNWNATAVCAFDAAASAGTYKVVADSWVDYHAGDIITVTAGPGANQLSFLTYPSTTIGGSTDNVPTVVDVDATTGAVTIAKQPTGHYGDGTATEVGGTGFIFSCTGGINLSIDVYYGGDKYAAQTFTLQKQ
jgi:hypothetical protein